MKKIQKLYSCLVFMASSSLLLGDVTNNGCFLKASPYFSPRSQSVDSARDLVGLANDWHIHLFDVCDMYGNFAVTAEYAKTFRSSDIARTLIGDGLTTTGDCNGPTIKISGSQVASRGPRDWLADYFGLPTDFQGTITLSPSVKTFLVDFDLFLGLDECMEGLYFRVHAPFVHSRWSLGYCEDPTVSGVNGYAAGYFSPYAVDNSKLVKSFEGYIANGQVPELNGGVSFEPLRYSKWAVGDCRSSLKENRLSEIQLVLGYDWFQCEDYHFGFLARGSVPTGTKPHGEYLFEPVIGNGHHWELGGGLTGHYTFWRGCNNDRSMGIYADINITHLFNSRQCRNFDLCQSPNSRYMLAERLGKPVENCLLGNPTPATEFPSITVVGGYTTPSYQFKKIFTPVANLTQSRVKVSVPVQVDLSILLNYSTCSYSFDIGYNFWSRSCENISFDCACPSPLSGQAWALKGDAQVYGFPLTACPSGTGVGAVGNAIALSATEQSANIYGGTNRPCGAAVLSTDQLGRNPNIDNPQYANTLISPNADCSISAGFASLISISDISAFDPCNPAIYELATGFLINTSVDPVFLTTADIDCQGARTRGRTHKIFGHVSYTWSETECGYLPFVGFGAKAEFAQNNKNQCNEPQGCFVTTLCTDNCCDSSCKNSALSEWGIWIKGGVTFN